MKLISQVCRILVGCLFVFSGFIKLNDPNGFAYQLEEYFEVFAHDFSPVFLYFVPHCLFISVLVCALEVVLGVAILLFYRMNWTMVITLLLSLFFTFLTFYSFYFDKVKECGCFGTAIPMTAFQSFLKNIVLLIPVCFLFFRRYKLKSLLSSKTADIAIVFASLLTLGLGYYAVEHLPLWDTLSYKVGNNIPELMKPKEKPRYKWILERNGKEYEFDDKNYPTDTTFKYKKHVLLTDSTKLIPEIVGFRIENEEGDVTEKSLQGEKLFIVMPFIEKAKKNCNGRCMDKLNNLVRSLEKETQVKPMVLTGHGSANLIEEFRHEMQLAAPYYFVDETVLKTIVRANPGVILLKDGVVKGKWHYNDIPEVNEIKSLLK